MTNDEFMDELVRVGRKNTRMMRIILTVLMLSVVLHAMTLFIVARRTASRIEMLQERVRQLDDMHGVPREHTIGLASDFAVKRWR